MSEAVKAARISAKAERDRQRWELARTMLANPVTVGLGALAVNRLLFASGAYKQLPKEKETSILGGPVWFTIGTPLPMEQERYEKVNLFIVTACTAWALGSGGSRMLLESVGGIGKVLA